MSSAEKSPLLAAKPRADPPAPCAVVCCGHRDVLWPAKLTYFAFNAAQSAGLNFVTLYWQNVAHFDKAQIGLLQTLLAVCAVVAPPLWGAIADSCHAHRAMLIMTIALGSVFMYAVHFTTSFPVTLCFAFLSYFQQSSVSPLLDHAVLGMLTMFGGEWGKQRLFAAFGWGLGAYLTSVLVTAKGISWAFNTNLIMSAVALVVLRYIPVQPAEPEVDATNTDTTTGNAEVEVESLPSSSSTLRVLASQTHVLALLAVVLCMGTMHGAIGVFLPLYMFNLSGQNAQIVGTIIFVETVSELPAFFFADKIIKRIGTITVLLLAVAAFATRLTYYAFVQNAWTVLPFELLHGLTFSLFWAAATQYLYAASPRGWEGTFLGLLAAAQFGVGYGTGTLVGGFTYQHYGASRMWLVIECCVPIALVGVAVFARVERNRNARLAEAACKAKEQQLAEATAV